MAACAKAAVARVKESDVLTQPLKREFTVKFKELKKYPGKLASLWPQLEVEFLWLGLTAVICRTGKQGIVFSSQSGSKKGWSASLIKAAPLSVGHCDSALSALLVQDPRLSRNIKSNLAI